MRLPNTPVAPISTTRMAIAVSGFRTKNPPFRRVLVGQSD
jgi:hypothetical protein